MDTSEGLDKETEPSVVVNLLALRKHIHLPVCEHSYNILMLWSGKETHKFVEININSR